MRPVRGQHTVTLKASLQHVRIVRLLPAAPGKRTSKIQVKLLTGIRYVLCDSATVPARRTFTCSASGISSYPTGAIAHNDSPGRSAALRCFSNRFRLLRAVKNPACCESIPVKERSSVF